jgi:hypothetical protein
MFIHSEVYYINTLFSRCRARVVDERMDKTDQRVDSFDEKMAAFLEAQTRTGANLAELAEAQTHG